MLTLLELILMGDLIDGFRAAHGILLPIVVHVQETVLLLTLLGSVLRLYLLVGRLLVSESTFDA